MKKNLKVYVMILLIAILFQNFTYVSTTINSIFSSKGIVKIYTDDTYLAKLFSKNYKVNHYKLEYASKNQADVIISANEIESEDYNLIDEYLYSPIICYKHGISTNLTSDDGYHTSYLNIFKGLMNDQKFKDIGLYDSSKISVYVPDNASQYVDFIKDEFAYLLKNESFTVDELYNKCIKVSDLKGSLDSSDTKGIVLAPEFIGKNASVTQLYDNQMISIKYHVYVHKEIEDTNIKSVLFSQKFNQKYFLRSSENYVLKNSYVQTIVEYFYPEKQVDNTSETMNETIDKTTEQSKKADTIATEKKDNKDEKVETKSNVVSPIIFFLVMTIPLILASILIII